MKLEKIDSLKRLVDKYINNATQYLNSDYNETELRNDFLNEFFELLGWDVLNKENKSQFLRDVRHEYSLKTPSTATKKRPDYLFRILSQKKFFLEAKKPSVDILKDKNAVYQLRSYGWTAGLSVSIISNFNDIIIYDTNIKPDVNDDTNVGIIAKYNVNEYIDKFDKIYGLISKEAVLNGSLEKSGQVIEKQKFDEVFLIQLDDWRKKLAVDIVSNNTNVKNDELNNFIQRLINKIIFIRICEDRGLEPCNELKNINSYYELKVLFVKMDDKYNSGIFNCLDNDKYNLSDNLIKEIISGLYYPNPYSFEAMDPYIIGSIYDMFLQKYILVNDDNSISVESKDDVINENGAIHTPKYIADYIVKNRLDNYIIGKKVEEIDSIKVADICSGAGIFLLSAYEYLIEYHINNGSEVKLDSSNNKALTFKKKRDILLNNIYGVDIDPQAVEVTKFTLLLKLLDEVTEEEVKETLAKNEKILPKLENVKIGNSLIGEEIIDFLPNVLTDIDLFSKIKPFEFTEWFDELGIQGFDCIIGNPPYVRVQNISKYSKHEFEFFKSDKSDYIAAKSEAFDKYMLFLEKALKLISKEGVVGYLVPNKFLVSKNSNGRNIVKEYLDELIDFQTEQIFKGVLTYVSILSLSKKKSDKVKYSIIEPGKLKDWEINNTCKTIEYSREFLNQDKWYYNNMDTETREKLYENTNSLNYFCDIFVGLQTSADNIYVIKPINEDSNYVYFKDCNSILRKIEKGILKKGIYDVKLKRFEKIMSNVYYIFPYKGTKKVGKQERAIPYELEEIKNIFPECYSYLMEFESELKNRSRSDKNEKYWFKYGRSQSLTKFTQGEYLILTTLSKDGNYVYCNDNIMFTGGGNGPYYGIRMKENISQLSILYIQSILSYPIIEELVKMKTSKFQGNYYSHMKQYIQDLPIKNIDFTKSEEKNLHDKIVEVTKNIMNLSDKIQFEQDFSKMEILNNMKAKNIKALDALLKKLYGV